MDRVTAVWNDDCSQSEYPGVVIDVVEEKGREIVCNILFDDGTERTGVPRNEVTHIFSFLCSSHFSSKDLP